MKRLFAAAAFAPLCFAAHQAQAQTTINSATTTPIVTSSALNTEITTTGSVTVTTGAPAVTVNSDHTLTVNGPISVRDSATGGTAILVVTPTGGLNSTINISSNLAADDTVANTDVDKDGDLDGVFVPGNVIRYGLRITGSGPFNGNITTNSTNTTAVEGNAGSSGLLIETPLNGNLTLKGTVGVLGSDTYGVRLQGPVKGNVSIGGLVNAQGQNAVGVQIDSDVDGVLRFDGSITSTGYRYANKATAPDITKLDADDLLQGGVALRISGNLTKGLVIDAARADRDATDTDDDDDGILDANETSAVIKSIGSAPALLVGHATNNITLGGVGHSAFPTLGVHINGEVLGEGLYDGVSATGARIGGLGGKVDTTGGVIVRGRVVGGAFMANATGLIIGSGTSAPNIFIDGGAEVAANIASVGTTTPFARAIIIEQGADAIQFVNSGTLGSVIVGGAGNAVALTDQSGTLKTIINQGSISAQINAVEPETTPAGSRIAFDLRNNTNGVEIEQSNGGNTNVVERIIGDILFAATGDDILTIKHGRTSGAVEFGGGDDKLDIASGASSRMDLRKVNGGLGVELGGDLTLTNTNRVSLTSLHAAPTSLLTFTADPKNADSTRRATFVDVSGTATLDAGSKLDLEFLSKINGLTTFEVLRANSLVNNGVNTALVNDLPFIFAGSARISGNSIFVDVRKRTAAEIGLLEGRGAAYDAFYAAFDADPAVARVVLQKTNAADFSKLFDQFLPDYSGGPFNGLANATRAVFQAQGEEVKDMVPGEPRSWLQEVGVGTKFESVNDIDYQTGGFAVAGGIEHQFGKNQFYGFSGSFMSSEIRNANRALGSLLTGSALMSSIYWRAQEGPMVIDASFGGAYAWFESDRRIVDQDAQGIQNLIRQASADWTGAVAGGRLGVTYSWDAGPFYVKHDAVLDAVYVREGGYAENGGGQGVNLVVGERESYEVAAEAGILLGARFGRSFRWGPELRVAYRGQLDGGEGETIGHFVSAPGQPFILPGLIKDRQRIVVRAALRGSGAYSNFAFEASGDIGEIYQAYMARFVVRFLF